MFELTFLGTSAGIPTKYRNVTALAVECVNPYLSNDKQSKKSERPWVLIDCGEGTQHQLLHTKLSVNQLTAICITHVHGDHCYGLPGLLASMSMGGRKDKLTLIAPRAIAKFLDAVTIATELYFDYPIEFIAIEDFLRQESTESDDDNHVTLDFSPNHQLNIKITALSHRVPSHAFSLTQTVKTRRLKVEKLKNLGIPAGKIWGALQRGREVTLNEEIRQVTGLSVLKADDYVEKLSVSTKIVVAGDNDNPSLLKEAIQGTSLLIHESTYTQAVADNINARPDSFDPMHTTAKSIATFAQDNQLPNLILTHFSARYQPFDDCTAKDANMSDIRIEVENFYQGKFWLAYDFSRFTISDNSVEVLKDNRI